MSRFVTSGTVNEGESSPPQDSEWKKAQDAIDNTQQSKERAPNQDEGKSLYESIRLKNQFRALDEDEVDFLDSVLESTRANAANIQQETIEQLDSFRKKREDIEKAHQAEHGAEGQEEDETHWGSGGRGRKRKKARDKDSFPHLKKRKSSAADEEKPASGSSASAAHSSSGPSEKPSYANGEGVGSVQGTVSTDVSSATAVRVGQSASTEQLSTRDPAGDRPSAGSRSLDLGLGAYSSDED
ncbi:MAG: hypothetical protein M1831_005809 [Alyxoria varia]|nr:MAG: hypothetical protein M1831_005809 [Alyxoria varia]